MNLAAEILSWIGTTGPSRLVTPLSPDTLPGVPGASDLVETARLSPAAAGILMTCSLLVSAGLLAWAFWWWRTKSEKPADTAFRILARRCGLRPTERSLIQKIAAERHVKAAALLVSIDALRASLHDPRQGAEEPVRAWLLKRCG